MSTELIPKHNETFGKLSAQEKDTYITLMQVLGEDEQRLLEKKVRDTKDPGELAKAIEVYKTYQDLLRFLPKPEQLILKQKFKALHSDDQKALIEQYASPLQVIKNAPSQTSEIYIDLLEVLPVDQATALKSQIVKCRDSKAVDQCIALSLPREFKELDDHAKATLFKLPADKRREVLRHIMHPGADVNAPLPSAVAPPSYKGATDPKTPSAAKLDISTLIQQKVHEAQDRPELSQDGWGPRLLLKGKKRRQFVELIMGFEKKQDRDTLKALFNRVDLVVIMNVVLIYALKLTPEEAKDLFSTLIYLYKSCPDATVAMCQNELSFGQKLMLRKNTTSGQREVLKNLERSINELMEDPYGFKDRYMKEPDEDIDWLIDKLNVYIDNREKYQNNPDRLFEDE